MFGLKIDHVMVRGITMTRARTIVCSGSDHRGVIVDIYLGAGSATIAEGRIGPSG